MKLIASIFLIVLISGCCSQRISYKKTVELKISQDESNKEID